MRYIKTIGFSFVYILSTILILSIIFTLFNYFNIINDKILSILNILTPIAGLLIGGFYIGKHSTSKGYIEGLKLGTIFSVLLIIFNFLAFNNHFKVKYILFYLIIIVSAILGSMIGINKKEK